MSDHQNDHNPRRAQGARTRINAMPFVDMDAISPTEIRLPASAFTRTAFAITTDKTRFYLRGWFIDIQDDRTLRVVTTDAQRLACLRPDPDKILVGAEAKSVIVSSDEAAKFITQASKMERRVTNDIVRSIIIDTATGAIRNSLDARTGKTRIDGTYPDYKRVCPSREYLRRGTRASFNARYLGDFANLSESPKAAGLTILATSPPRTNDEINGPHVVLVDGVQDAFGIIMPCRPFGNDTYPEWF